MANCKSCGALLSGDEKFCGNCGAACADGSAPPNSSVDQIFETFFGPSRTVEQHPPSTGSSASSGGIDIQCPTCGKVFQVSAGFAGTAKCPYGHQVPVDASVTPPQPSPPIQSKPPAGADRASASSQGKAQAPKAPPRAPRCIDCGKPVALGQFLCADCASPKVQAKQQTSAPLKPVASQSAQKKSGGLLVASIVIGGMLLALVPTAFNAMKWRQSSEASSSVPHGNTSMPSTISSGFEGIWYSNFAHFTSVMIVNAGGRGEHRIYTAGICEISPARWQDKGASMVFDFDYDGSTNTGSYTMLDSDNLVSRSRNYRYTRFRGTLQELHRIAERAGR